MPDQTHSSFFFGPFELDVAEQRLLRDGGVVPLTPKTFDLLRLLVVNSGRLMLKDDLLAQLWPDTFVDAASLSRSISVLRAALGDGDGPSRYIETVPKRGYRFVAAVRGSTPPAADVEAKSASSVDRGAGVVKAGVALACVVVLTMIAYLLLTRVPAGGRLPAPLHRQLTSTGREGAPALSPDGGSMAYVSTLPSESVLAVQNLGSDQMVIVYRAPEISGVRWSPDGQRLLFFARNGDTSGLFAVSRSGGPAREVAAGLFKGCWSPDGLRVAAGVFLRGRILLVDGDGRRQFLDLTGSHRWIWDIDWSAAADRLLVVSDDDRGHYRIWTIRPDGSDQRLEHEERVELRGARWAPDGRAIYFSRHDDQTTSFFKLAIPAAERGAPIALPLLSGLETTGAFTVSSDGRQLAYARAPYHSNLWAVHLQPNAGAPPVTTPLTTGTTLIERPRLSPDGTTLVFNQGYDGRANLFVMPVTGGRPRQLTFLNALSIGGIWSPDGDQVAFASNDGGRPRAWVVSADGGTAHAVSNGTVSDSYVVAWSSRSRIVYQHPDNRDFVFVDTANAREEGRLLGQTAGGWVFSPELAPDRRHLALEWVQAGRHGVWLFNLLSGDRRLLLQQNAMPIGWAAGGKSVYAVKFKPGVHRGQSVILGETTRETRVLEIPVDGRPAREVLLLPFEEVGGVTISADGRTIVCAVYSSRSDVWIVENFDAAAIAAGAVPPPR